MYEKECITCKDYKPKDKFSVRRQAKDGLDSVCKDCKLAISKAKRERNRFIKKEQEIINESVIKIANGPWRLK